MNPSTPDEADLERLLTDRLDAEVRDVTAGPALLDRIRADAGAATGARIAGGPSARWLLPIAAAAAAVVAVVSITVDDDGGTDVATREELDAPETQVTRENVDGSETPVVLSGETGGADWSIVEYVEDDPGFVDEPTTCLRFEPAIEEGPFFCGSDEHLLGAHGRLVLRRGQRFADHAVFAGVFSPEVAEIALAVDGQQIVVAPQPWPGRKLRVAVVMQPVPDDVDYDVILRDVDDQVLSRGGSSSGGN